MVTEFVVDCSICKREITIAGPPQRGIYQCRCGEFFAVEKVNWDTGTLTRVHLNKEEAIKTMREENML